MKPTFVIIIALIAFSCAIITACNNSLSPTNPQPTAGQFSFTVGNRFQFSNVATDTNGATINGSQTTVHETIVASGKTIAGVSNAYLAIDSTFNTSQTLVSVDSIYYSTDGSTLKAYGFFSYLYGTHTGGKIVPPPSWSTIASINTNQWLVDSAMGNAIYNGYSTQNFYFAAGYNYGLVSFALGSASLSASHASDTGYINGTGASGTKTITVNETFTCDVQVTFQPTIPAVVKFPATDLYVYISGIMPYYTQITGFNRVLTSWSAQ